MKNVQHIEKMKSERNSEKQERWDTKKVQHRKGAT